MSLIKVRESKEPVKSHKQGSVSTSHAKNAYIRTKVQGQRAMDDSENSPNEYASDNAQYMMEDAVHDAGHVVTSGTKAAIHKGQEVYRKHKAQATAQRGADPPPPSGDVPYAGTPHGEVPTDHAPVQPQHSSVRTPGRDYNPMQSKEALEKAKISYQAKQWTTRKERVDQALQTERNAVAAATEKQADLIHTANGFSNPSAANQAGITVRGDHRPGQKPTVRFTSNGKRHNLITVRKTAHAPIKAHGSSQVAIKSTQATAKATQRTAKASYRTARATAQAAKAFAQKAVVAAKATGKFLVSSVKAAIAGAKALVSAIAAGGWVAIIAVVIICLIGMIVGSSFGIFFSSEDTGSGQTIQEVVREINDEYVNCLDEIKASVEYDELKMSGARAVWPEVLAIYAVKTTTDPDNPQEVASITDEKIELLRDIFWQMNEIDHETDDVTEMELVESDDGNGNIVEDWQEVTNTYLYITVSHKSAEEMAEELGFDDDQMEQLEELLADKNSSLWTMVLYGINASDDMIVAVALSQVGNVGGEPYWSWYGFGSRVEWCACFVSWCANECGYIDAGVIPKFAGCINGVNWFKERGQWADNSAEPTPGMIIFFDWDDPDEGGQDGLSDHVGIVEKVENGRVYTVEGNSGDSCRQKSYPLGYYQILGYGVLCP